MNALDSAANALSGAKYAADALTPTPTEAPPAPPTLGDRARATACEYTGLGCDVVEDVAQPVADRPRHTTEATWFGRTEDGGVAVVEQTLADGSSMRGAYARAEPGDIAVSTFGTLTRFNEHFALQTNFMAVEQFSGVRTDGTNTTIGASQTATAIEFVGQFEGENVRGYAGLSVGSGASVKVAREDADRDGVPEVCLGGSAGVGTAGACVEVPRSIAPAVDKAFDLAAELSPQRIIYRLCN